MEFAGKSRQTVSKMLKRAGYTWQYWNEDGTELEASSCFAGITLDTIFVSFTPKGRAKKQQEV